MVDYPFIPKRSTKTSSFYIRSSDIYGGAWLHLHHYFDISMQVSMNHDIYLEPSN